MRAMICRRRERSSMPTKRAGRVVATGSARTFAYLSAGRRIAVRSAATTRRAGDHFVMKPRYGRAPRAILSPDRCSVTATRPSSHVCPARPKNRRAAPTGFTKSNTMDFAYWLGGRRIESGYSPAMAPILPPIFPRSPPRSKASAFVHACSTARPSWSTSAASRSSTLSVIGSANMTPCYVPSICSSSTAPTCAATHLRSHER
jgi:hypothetical protein